MALTDSAGILFKIKADSSDAVRDINHLEKEMAGLGTAGSALAGSLTSLINPATLLSSGLAAIAAGAVIAAKALFDLTKNTGEYGDQLFDTAQKTNVSTDAIQAWNFAAEQSGSSVELVNKTLAKFSALLGQASDGNDEAQATLKKYGVTALDTDEALQQAIESIAKMTDANQQNSAAAALFKDRGGDVINMIREMDGDLPGTIQHLREMGLLMGEDDVEAAARFTDTLDLLDKQLAGVGRTLGTELLPIFLEWATSVSDWLKENQGEVKRWSGAFVSALNFVIDYMRVFYNLTTGLADAIISGAKIAAQVVGQNLTEAGLLYDAFAKRQEERLKNIGERLAHASEILSGTATPSTPRTQEAASSGRGRGATDAELEEQRKAAEKAAKEREEIAKRNADAQVQILKNQLAEAEEAFQKAFDALKKQFDADGDEGGFLAGYEQAVNVRNQAIVNQILPALEAAELKVAKQSKATTKELELLAQEQVARQVNASDEALKAAAEKDKLIVESAKKANKETYDDLKNKLDDEVKLREAATKTVLARMEKDVAAGGLTEKQLMQFRITSEADLFNLRLSNLKALLAAAKGNAEEEKRLKLEIKLLEEERDESRYRSEKEVGDLQRENAKELLELKKQIADEERRILDFRAEQERKVLVNVVDSATNRKAKKEAIEELAKFDVLEAVRKAQQREADIEAERTAALERVKGKENEEDQKFAIEEAYNLKRLGLEEEFQERIKEIREKAAEAKAEEDEGGFFGTLFGGLDDATGNIRDFEDVIESLGAVAEQTFMAMGRGLGNMVQQWVLLGDQANVSMKKMVASVLAGVAAQAATLAIFHLAMGIAALTPWGAAMYGSPTNHFIAAAIWGSIAVGAALAGRAIAGDSFKKETASATGGASGAGASRDTSSQGQQFSGNNKEQIVDINANQPAKTVGVPVTVTLKIADDSTWLGKMLKADVETNGGARQQIKLIAQDA